jgi:P27 family predicted phage terminase small subunit
VAQEYWDELAPLLDGMGVLTRADKDKLALYCRTWAQWRIADKFIEDNGMTYVTRDADGQITSMQQFPQVAIRNKLSLILIRLAQEFGLTPSARTRVHANVETKRKAPPPSSTPQLRIAQ